MKKLPFVFDKGPSNTAPIDFKAHEGGLTHTYVCGATGKGMSTSESYEELRLSDAEVKVAIPSRAGKSAIGNQMVFEQYADGRKIVGGHLWNEPKAGVRKPLSADRKAKVRKAAKAAAKSRRRNHQ